MNFKKHSYHITHDQDWSNGYIYIMSSTTRNLSISRKRHHREITRRASVLSVAIDERKSVAAHSPPYFRWIVLLIICFSGFASYGYCFYNPMALQEQMQSTYHLSNLQYNSLFSACSFPNMILPLFSGVLSDMVGAALMTIIFFVFVCIGQSTFVIGCSYSDGHFPMMLAGRFMFGIGSESYSLAITPLIYEYFKNKELALALGSFGAFIRIGASVNNITTFWIYTKTGSIIWAFSIGLMLLAVALILIILLLLQRYCVRKRIRMMSVLSGPYKTLPAHSINHTVSEIHTVTIGSRSAGSMNINQSILGTPELGKVQHFDS